MANLKKRIWFMWLAGMQNPPEMVQKCYDAWKYYNPDWELTVLCRDNLHEYVDLEAIIGTPDYQQMEVQALSNIIRLNVLAKHGGVWSDATVLCRKPLESWLPLFAKEGYFAFDRPGPERPIATWFMYGDPKSRLLNCLNDVSNRFWRENPYRATPSSSVAMRQTRFKTMKVIRFNGEPMPIIDTPENYPILWGEEETYRVMECFSSGETIDWEPFKHVHPYFWLHYMFTHLIEQDADFSANWLAVPKISADLPHSVQFYGLHEKPDATFSQIWNRGIAPVLKLNQWQASEIEGKSTILDFILNKENWENPPEIKSASSIQKITLLLQRCIKYAIRIMR